MARCESIDALPEVEGFDNAEIQIINSSDSELEKDVPCSSNIDVNDRENSNPDSPESSSNEQLQVNAGPILSLQCLHDDNVDEIPQLMPVKIVAVNSSPAVSSSTVSHPHSSIPSWNNWDGVHNFKIKIHCSDRPKKSESPAFSESQNKLYIAKDHPFKVLIYAENVPMGSLIKVTTVFALVVHSYEIVQRCPTHAQQDFSKGNPAYEHFVQSFSDTAIYTKSDSGKLSVSVPYEKPQEGETFTTYLFKLTCFSSCSGGINRRPFMLIFTLEKDNVPLGRQTIEAKVCACPLRDFKVDEEREHRKKSKSNTRTYNKRKSSLSSGGETTTTKYTISVKDPELYLFLKQMKCLYDMSAYSSKVQSDTC